MDHYSQQLMTTQPGTKEKKANSQKTHKPRPLGGGEWSQDLGSGSRGEKTFA